MESKSRRVRCPFCTETILAKTKGRMFASITGWVQRSWGIKIDTGFLDWIKERLPVAKAAVFKNGCPTCKGKRFIEDPSDQSAQYEQVKKIAESKVDELMELESQLGLGGDKHTIVQGNELLEVGLGLNTCPSWKVVKDASIRNKGLLDPSNTNVKAAGPQIPEGGRCNHIQGINALPLPGGHYTIKCSNKFNLIAGAQGVEITSGGPVTIGGGITRISGPEILLGSQTGRLSLQGDVVDIVGKSIEVAPTDGHFYVKGTISNSGNLITAGHSHAESLSFVHADCVGRNETSKIGAPSDLSVGPAFWGGVAAEAVTSSLKDMLGNALATVTHPVHAQQLLSMRFWQNQFDKLLSTTYQLRPYELVPTGYILPGTVISLIGTCPCNYPSPGSQAAGPIFGTVLAPVTLNNFPHNHPLPDLVHTHETRVPDIDCSSDTAAQVRGKQSGIGLSAPLHKTSTGTIKAALGLWTTIGSIWTATWSAFQNTFVK